jgi:hypothetical protein
MNNDCLFNYCIVIIVIKIYLICIQIEYKIITNKFDSKFKWIVQCFQIRPNPLVNLKKIHNFLFKKINVKSHCHLIFANALFVLQFIPILSGRL